MAHIIHASQPSSTNPRNLATATGVYSPPDEPHSPIPRHDPTRPESPEIDDAKNDASSKSKKASSAQSSETAKSSKSRVSLACHAWYVQTRTIIAPARHVQTKFPLVFLQKQ